MAFEKKWHDWDKIPINPRMLPKQERAKRLGSGFLPSNQLTDGKETRKIIADKSIDNSSQLDNPVDKIQLETGEKSKVISNI